MKIKVDLKKVDYLAVTQQIHQRVRYLQFLFVSRGNFIVIPQLPGFSIIINKDP